MKKERRNRYIVTITTDNREQWEHLIKLGREIGPERILSSVETNKIGIVYVFHAIDTKFFKIGFSSNHERIEKRLAEIQTGCPYELKIIESFKTYHYRYIEKFLHIMFDEYRIRNEWFEFGNEQIEKIHTFFHRFQ